MSLPSSRGSPWGSDWREQKNNKTKKKNTNKKTPELCLRSISALKWAARWCCCPLRCQWRFPPGKTQGPGPRRRTSRRAHPPWRSSSMWPAPCTTTWSRSSRARPRSWKHPWADQRDLCITLLWCPSTIQVISAECVEWERALFLTLLSFLLLLLQRLLMHTLRII